MVSIIFLSLNKYFLSNMSHFGILLTEEIFSKLKKFPKGPTSIYIMSGLIVLMSLQFTGLYAYVL